MTPAHQQSLRVLRVKPSKDAQPDKGDSNILDNPEGGINKTCASKLIDGIKRTRRRAYLLGKALHKEVDVETMQWLEQFVVEHEM